MNKIFKILVCGFFVFLLLGTPVFALAQNGRGFSDIKQLKSARDLPKASKSELELSSVEIAPNPIDNELRRYKQQLGTKGLKLNPNAEEDTFSLISQLLSPLATVDDESLAPSNITNFAGITYTSWIPPDPTIAVGPNHIVVMVNSSIAIYNKSGTLLSGPTALSTWFSGLSLGSVFDPKVVYDNHSGRWITMAVTDDDASASAYLVSVSSNSDPTGSWVDWSLDADVDGSTASSNWADYPQIGFDENAVYITSNQFPFAGGSSVYSKLRILKKSELYGAGPSVTWSDFWNYQNADGTKVFTWQPVHTLTTGAGKEWLVNTESRLSGDAITLYSVTNPMAATPTLTREATIAISSFSAAPDPTQLGGASALDNIDARLLNAVYRNNRIYTTFTEAYNWGSGSVSAIRYDVIDIINKRSLIDSTYGSDGVHYYYPVIYPDNFGNIVLMFNRSNSSEYASIYYSGRLTTDSQIQASSLLKAGEAYYYNVGSGTRNRWGDYSGAGLDPSSGNVWVYGEYSYSLSNWRTWVGELNYASSNNTAIDTTLATSSPNGTKGRYKSYPSITLTGSKALSTTYYQWNSTNGSWTVYSAPFNALLGTNTLYYYSEDFAGNTHNVKSQQFKVALESKLTLKAKKRKGKTYNFSGQLKDKSGAALKKKKVLLQKKVVKKVRKKVKKKYKIVRKVVWVTVAKDLTDTRGKYSVNARVAKTTTYRAHFAGVANYYESNSKARKITVKR